MTHNRIPIFILVVVAMAGVAAAQMKRVSPHETTELTVNGKKISVTYGRPSLKGRKVGVELAPFGKVWRTGADEATMLNTEADLTLGNLAIPKGSYSIYTLPSESGWKLIVNKMVNQWGTVYDEKQDFGRVDMKVGKTSAPVEQFTIKLAKSGNGGVIKLEWENTSASVNFQAK
jgi:DUF2911 family protein